MSSTREMMEIMLKNQQLILSSLDSLNQQFTNLENKIDGYQHTVDGYQHNLNQHINFVENVYDSVRHPINYITGYKLKSITDK